MSMTMIQVEARYVRRAFFFLFKLNLAATVYVRLTAEYIVVYLLNRLWHPL